VPTRERGLDRGTAEELRPPENEQLDDDAQLTNARSPSPRYPLRNQEELRGPARLVCMSTTGYRNDVGTRFDLDDQHAETINNVGGDQNIFLPWRSIVLPSGTTGALTPAERAAAALGLLFFWTGVLLVGLTAWATVDNVLDAQQAHTLSAPYTDYVSGPWKLGLGLIFTGVVVPRLALRLFGRSEGAG
jgi:hypothetical protein